MSEKTREELQHELNNRMAAALKAYADENGLSEEEVINMAREMLQTPTER